MKKQFVFKALPAAIALASASMTLQAIETEVAGVRLQFDNTITYGTAVRTEDADPRSLSKYGLNGTGGGSASTYNYDDGNRNFENGDLITNTLKWSGDFDINYDDYIGAFFRGRYFYDKVIADNDLAYKELPDASIDAAGNGYELLDAFLWSNFDIGDTPLSFRIGRQVVSWGESTFILGGINSINPIDAAAIRKPGAEVKEALLPVNMVYTSVGITDNLSLEAFYQLQWSKTRSDPCGTYFSTVDFVADGCGPVLLAGSIGEQSILDARQDQIDNAIPLEERTSGPVAERLADEKPKNEGQFGVAFRYYSEALGDTEFGLYYMNIHSRLPYTAGQLANPTGVNPNNPAARFTQYQIAYPEDIKIMGLSFNTTVFDGTSFGGEVSLKQDFPMQHNSFELILGGSLVPSSKLYVQRANESQSVRDALAAANLSTTLDPNNPQQVAVANTALGGEYLEGWDRFDIVQAQATMIHFFDQFMGASRFSLVGEVGFTFVQDLPSLDEARYGKSGHLGIGSFDPLLTGSTDANGNPTYYTCDASAANSIAGGLNGEGFSNETPANCDNDGYVDEISGGIRVRGNLEYTNALFGMTVIPNFSLAYDVGNGPEPGSQFIDGRSTTSLGVKFDYLNQWQFGFTYTNYAGGGKYNILHDRDNFAFSAGVSF